MKLKLKVDGKLYEVEVEVAEPEQPRPSYIPAAASGGALATSPSTPAGRATGPKSSQPDSVSDESKVCRSPISGVVVRVSAQPGQQIQANDVLMLLEAMKMETVITSPIAGTIAKVNAKAGDSVQSGQILVEFQ